MCNLRFLIFLLVVQWFYFANIRSRHSAKTTQIETVFQHLSSQNTKLAITMSQKRLYYDFVQEIFWKYSFRFYFIVDTLKGNRNKNNFPDGAAPNRSWMRNVIAAPRRPMGKSRYALWLSRGKNHFYFRRRGEIRFQKFPVARTDGGMKTSRVTHTKKKAIGNKISGRTEWKSSK